MEPVDRLLQGVPNFRDIGGYRTRDGRTVRRGRIFRSEALTKPTEADLETLTAIGVRLVCDVRGPREREAAPNRWPDGLTPEALHLDITQDLRSGDEHMVNAIAADPTAAGVRKMMLANYGLMPKAFAGRLGPFLDRLVSGDNFPAVFHCAAGKDRTGFVSAMLLLTLDVPMETVHRDYALTEQFMDLDRMMVASAAYIKTFVGQHIDPDPAMLRGLCGTSPDYLDAAFAAIGRDYGSVDFYLAETAGFDAGKRARLLELMLE